MKPTHIVVTVLLAVTAGACGGPKPPERAAPVSYQLRPLVRGGSPFHGVHGLRFDKNDTLYAGSVIGQSIYKVDTQTGRTELFVGPP